MQRDLFLTTTVEWLNRRVVPAGVSVDADTRLFESGIIDSLGILRLIAWTEQAIGRRIQDREIRMDRFGSVVDIADAFVTGAAAERGLAAVRGCGAERACARCGACPRRAA